MKNANALEPVLQCLPELRPFILDAGVSEIQLNGDCPGAVWVERDGVSSCATVRLDPVLLESGVKRLARAVGEPLFDSAGRLLSPLLNCRFADGSRLAVVFPPHSIHGITLVLRKFNVAHLGLDDLIERGMMTQEAADILTSGVVERKNILLSGSTGTGKTTVANVLLDAIPAHERVLTIENPAEFQSKRVDPEHSKAVRWEARADCSQADLLQQALRFHPDRIVLGEFRGPEAFDLLTLMNTGCSGTLSTCHAESAKDALTRFLTCCLMDRRAPSEDSLRRMIGGSVQIVAHLAKNSEGVRKLNEIVTVDGYETKAQKYHFATLYGSVAESGG